MPLDVYNFQFAIVSRIPDSFSRNASNLDSNEPIDLGLAIRQHNDFIEILRTLGIDVLELPPDERHPDCVFVADVAVVINGTALICAPPEKRLGETSIVRSTLLQDIGLRIVEVDSDTARIVGSDVLFTGSEIIVGVGKHTNKEGAQSVAKAFPEYAVTIVYLPPSIDCLTSVMTMAGPDVLVVSRGKNGQECLQELIQRATFSYRVIRVDEEAAANVIYANRFLLHLDDNVIPESFPIWEAKFDNRLVLDISELRKAGGNLTSNVILITRPSNYKKIFQTSLEKGHHELE